MCSRGAVALVAVFLSSFFFSFQLCAVLVIVLVCHYGRRKAVRLIMVFLADLLTGQ